MKINQFAHKVIVISYIRSAARQSEMAHRRQAWDSLLNYTIQNITCRTFRCWVFATYDKQLDNFCMINLEHKNHVIVKELAKTR
ncbi:hypothetical protein ACOZB2_32205 [Pantoea endophytica]|uniref:Uncharacterized protein n=1 Tax=Pantoea sp. BJ2 TaxID=3141322 RepID=A0AAU7U4B4_9GAMM